MRTVPTERHLSVEAVALRRFMPEGMKLLLVESTWTPRGLLWGQITMQLELKNFRGANKL